MQISARAFQRVFTCKVWPRYSRERAYLILINLVVSSDLILTERSHPGHRARAARPGRPGTKGDVGPDPRALPGGLPD